MNHYDGVHVTVGAAVSAPGATLWLRDKATSTRLLGRWHGGQQSGRWDDPPQEWTPRRPD